jgi:hypothetical protein
MRLSLYSRAVIKQNPRVLVADFNAAWGCYGGSTPNAKRPQTPSAAATTFQDVRSRFWIVVWVFQIIIIIAHGGGAPHRTSYIIDQRAINDDSNVPAIRV